MAAKYKKKQVYPAVRRILHRVRPRTLFYFLIPLICFYCLEFYTHDPWLMAFIPQLINYLLFLAAGLFLYELTGRSWCASAFLVLYSLIAGIANYFVMSFRNNPLLPWDLQSAKTAFSVSDNYNYDIDYRFVISTAILVLTMICGFVISQKHSRPLKSRSRLGICAGSLVFLLTVSLGMMNSTVTDCLLTPTNLFTQWASYRDNGFTVTFLQNLQYLQIKKPAGYNADTLDSELQEFLASCEDDPDCKTFLSDSSGRNQETEPTAEAPHIIAIMNESFSDLAVLHDFETNEDYMPYIHSLQKQNLPNLITGNLFVSVCGGNTANTEFEFLTGNSMAFLPSGSIPYQQYIKGDCSSLASQYGKDGYTSTGLHPYSASGWNRNLVYPWLGFDNSCFRDSFYPVQIIRKYVSDESAYNKLVSIYDQRGSREKLFLFEVTMQNHGGYSEIYDNFPIKVRLNDIHTKTSSATENYLTLIQESDRAFQNLISSFETADEPVIIIMFGDHQPNDYVSENIASLTGTAKNERSLEESQNRYVVPYVIWANFDLDKEAAGLSNHTGTAAEQQNLLNDNTLSSNYLGACLTRLAGLETTDYQKFLLILKKTLPVITANAAIDKEGNYMTIDEAKKNYPELINLYEKLQYRALFDQG
ncbi:MAG: sulfatase-like hydrolase/transferase [Lachnospiraceae bacterium]|nr:sulfatase-like hydrolase/transferase [Lachnospiraceae bacterium]MDY4968940.1 sulfatase-like hydrolase/transferase [Lachnospiraceae bacterium]